MNSQKPYRGQHDRTVRLGLTILLAVGLALSGCDSILDVENPNSLVQEDVEKPAAAEALTNGALATLARAVSEAMTAHDAASDELVFIGSQTAWLSLQQGEIRNPTNNHLEAIWPFVTEARWTTNNAVEVLSRFEADGVLPDPILLARSRLYFATIHTYIADFWEDFPLTSDRREPGPPVGPENMVQLYDMSLSALDQALVTARAEGAAELETRIMAQRARTKHARALWLKLNPPGSIPAAPLVSDAGMAEDARAALALAGSDTWRWIFEYSPGTVDNDWGNWVNDRLDLRISDAYVEPTVDGRRVDHVTLQDPIDGIVDPAAERRILEITNGRFDPITVVSAQELRLLLAEHALANGDMAGFAQHINLVRTQEGLTPWTGQIPALDVLKHMRRAHLFNQGRRLSDHYRFGEPSFMWVPTQEAVTRPGTRFPIPRVEIEANCHIQGNC